MATLAGPAPASQAGALLAMAAVDQAEAAGLTAAQSDPPAARRVPSPSKHHGGGALLMESEGGALFLAPLQRHREASKFVL